MSLTTLMAEALPLNRKEKYYTGTVFPGIVCADNFKHFNVFARLLPGNPSFDVNPNPASTNIQFFTEYSPLHSFVGASRARMLEIPASNETPDVAIVVFEGSKRTLIVLEAKVFQSTSASELSGQLEKQEPFIACVRASIGITDVYHAALIPKALLTEWSSFGYPVVTWDDIHGGYASVAPDNYFRAILGVALDSFSQLRGVGQQRRRQNAEAMITGEQIVSEYRNGTLAYTAVGRFRGLRGPELSHDVETGDWRSRRYEVNNKENFPRPNWIRVSDFVARVTAAERTQ